MGSVVPGGTAGTIAIKDPLEFDVQTYPDISSHYDRNGERRQKKNNDEEILQSLAAFRAKYLDEDTQDPKFRNW